MRPIPSTIALRTHATLAIALLGVLIGGCSRPTGPLAEASIDVVRKHPTVPHLAPAEAAMLASTRTLVVDVRSAEEWDVGHIPGALRLDDPQAVLAEARRRWSTTVLLVCSIGERSSIIAERCRAIDPDAPVANLAGGIFAWAIMGLPLVDGRERPVLRVHPGDGRLAGLLPADLRSDGAGAMATASTTTTATAVLLR